LRNDALRANFIIIGPVAWSVSLPSKEKQRASNCENRSRTDGAPYPKEEVRIRSTNSIDFTASPKWLDG
jgi:hypothetical protein